MQSLRNKVFAAIFSFFLIGPALLCLANTAGVSLPEWATSESATYLAGSQGDANVAEHLNFDGYKSRELQSSIEGVVGNSIPFKAAVLLQNAALQRSAIEMSNAFFGYDCYPTFFGSNYAYVPQYDALVAWPSERNDETIKSERAFGEGVCQLAKAYPDKRFIVYVPTMSSGAQTSPAIELTSNPNTVEQTVQNLKASGLPTNAFVLNAVYESAEEYYQEHFRSDHHWNAYGAEHAFNIMADALGLNPLKAAESISHSSVPYTGAYGRSGLVDIAEEAFDTDRDFSSITVHQGGKTSAYDHEEFESSPFLVKRYSFYDTYYPISHGSVFENPLGEGSALLLCDSFGAALLPRLALQYEHVYVYPDLSAAGMAAYINDDTRLSSLIDQLGCADVYFVCHQGNIKALAANCPHYFDV